MIYDEPFWTEMSYGVWSYVARSGEILIEIRYANGIYEVEKKKFVTLDAAKIFAIAVLKRLNKIDEDGNSIDPIEEIVKSINEKKAPAKKSAAKKPAAKKPALDKEDVDNENWDKE